MGDKKVFLGFVNQPGSSCSRTVLKFGRLCRMLAYYPYCLLYCHHPLLTCCGLVALWQLRVDNDLVD